MKTIHHVVDIDAAAEQVWTALVEPPRLAMWWSTSVATGEPEVGALVRWTFVGDFNPVMQITALEERRTLEWRCIDGHEPWMNSSFRFQIEPLDDARTRLRFWQEYDVELADDYYGVYNFNWGYYLESLRALCATGVGKPFRA